jgi:DNA-binding NtrC family response regulator
MRDIERDIVIETLGNMRGNRTASARLLGFSVRTLRNKITEYSADGFDVPPSRQENVVALDHK